MGVGEDGRGVAVLDPVVHRFGPVGVPRQAARLAQGGEGVSPSGDDLVHIGLVAGVPQDDVARRVEHPVDGQGQLHGAEIGSEMPARHRHGLDDEVTDLGGEGLQLAGIEFPRSAGPLMVSNSTGPGYPGGPPSGESWPGDHQARASAVPAGHVTGRARLRAWRASSASGSPAAAVRA